MPVISFYPKLKTRVQHSSDYDVLTRLACHWSQPFAVNIHSMVRTSTPMKIRSYNICKTQWLIRLVLLPRGANGKMYSGLKSNGIENAHIYWMRRTSIMRFYWKSENQSLYKNQSRALKTNLCRLPSVIHTRTVVELRIRWKSEEQNEFETILPFRCLHNNLK